MKTKSNKNSELKSRTAQHIEKQPELLQVDFNKRNRNRALPVERLLDLLKKEAPAFLGIGRGGWQMGLDSVRRETAERDYNCVV